MTDSTPKKVKNESLGENTMSRHQYYNEALCAIETAQSTTIDDDFPQICTPVSSFFYIKLAISFTV